ncbi:hypothetical protein FRB95_012649 [Tulasnella sp. JGI-2019a]|nr:hypothetical protein FRB95_012649 [Tulasnella sp. JGI-2019a]
MASISTPEVAPDGPRSFTIKHPKIPDPRSCTLGVQLGPLGSNQAQFLLIAATEPEDPYETPMFSRLSTILDSHPLKTPNGSGDYTFYMKTYSENETFLEQMIEQGTVERIVGAPEVNQGFVSFPLVEAKISLKEMSKQCAYCERWEYVTDEKRLRGCSRCKRVWYCNENHQKQDWKEGHKKLCGKW